ncbi:hypothetical protein AAFN60_20085 [Roseibacillus persicicus]|uniref:hypothetical protein n=1 Tax=Roseibacillus persicicus TaxID=454148 RepID=UPI00398B5D45
MSESSPHATSAKVWKGLAVAGGLYLCWFYFDQRVVRLEEEIAGLKEEVKVLAPLSNVMRGYRPDSSANSNDYLPQQATGPADVPEFGQDHPLAWCPATQDGGEEWLELHFGEPVLAKEIRLHLNLNPGAVRQVLGGSEEGELSELWLGDFGAEPEPVVSLKSPIPLVRVRFNLDTTRVEGWNQVDAVALIDESGAVHWARKARASSSWGNSPH